jgi:cytochrome c oxidase subunit II
MRRAAAFLLAALGLCFAAPVAAATLFEPHSPRIEYWNNLFMQIFWVSVFVAVLVFAVLLYAIIRFRHRKGGPVEGPHIHGNTKLEVAWTIAPAAVMAWLLMVSFNGLFAYEEPPAEPDFTIRIDAFQFAWRFTYEDGKTGTAPPDPIRIEQNRIVRFELHSDDVIHAFSVPELGIMKDAVPGRVNYDWTQVRTPGEYAIKCRELCGVGHSYMLGTLVVFPEGSQSLPWGAPDAPTAPDDDNGTTQPDQGNQTTDNRTLPDDARVITVDMGPGFVFHPNQLTAQKGETVVYRLTNRDTTTHNMYIGRAHGNAEWTSSTLARGQTENFVVEFPDEDVTFLFWCDVAGHYTAGMAGTLRLGAGSGDVGPRPLLPGFELMAVLAGLAVAAVFMARRR